MALPMSDPYRGYAPVTHDTNRTAEVITELNGLNVTVGSHAGSDGHAGIYAPNSHVNSNGHAGIYSPSALQYYLEANNGSGGGLVQTISNNTTTILTVAGFYDNRGGGFNGSNIYTVPAGGIYVMTGSVRVYDSGTVNYNIGLGIHDSNQISDHMFRWNQFFTGGGIRATYQYHRTASWNPGQQLRFYTYQDSGFALLLTAITLSIWRIG